MRFFEGNLLKMSSELREVVQYHLFLGGERVFMNDLIGKNIRMNFMGEIHCIACGRLTRKSFAQGYCFPCFKTSPETSECVLNPELCRAHEGVSRDMNWSKEHCLQDHIVYFANTNGLKVGVTRLSQVPTRWIDQGAKQAIPFLKTPNRFTAGIAETAMKKHFSDKTNWRNMLTDKDPGPLNLPKIKEEARELLPESLKQFYMEDAILTEIHYPIKVFPTKVVSAGFDYSDIVEGVLTGIRGQYLILEGGTVLNIRKHNGYRVRLEF
jgi:hypothetical protein